MSSPAGADFGTWLEESQAWCDGALERLVPGDGEHPALLHRAQRYALFGGGKRLRPALVRLVCRDLGGSDVLAERPAAALELVHTYSLVHDDLPCMDDDELRRGRPTVHVAYDEATAVLTGDALLTLAFELLAGAPDHVAELVGVLARASGSRGMVGGQVLDLNLERDPGAGIARVLDMHERTTAALFGAACELGAVAAGVDGDRRAQAADFGRSLGLLFQATDDLLDVTGDAATLGKTPGKDEALERPTLVAALGWEEARRQTAVLGEEARKSARTLGGLEGRAQEFVEYVLSRRT